MRKRQSHATNFYEQRLKDTNWASNNMCDPPSSADVCLKALKDELLGSDWYITMPEDQEQVNTAITTEIIRKYIDEPNEFPVIRVIVLVGCFLLGAVIGMLA
ncbi:MAG: hypothetical protein NC489_08495 [Ruminococcus flavefaciens]|nr:hypothetical protein [Ruminococcus flavefaciens]